MITCDTLLASYQQRVCINTHATVRHQMQHAENPTPAVIICMEATRVDNAIHPDYLTSEMALEKPEIRSTDPTIPIHNNCTDDELHFSIPGGCEEYDDDGDEINVSDSIATASRRRWAATELDRFDQGTSDVDGDEGDDGADADADVKDEESQTDDGLTKSSEYCGYSPRECDDWTVYIRSVKPDNGKADAMSWDVCEMKTLL